MFVINMRNIVALWWSILCVSVTVIATELPDSFHTGKKLDDGYRHYTNFSSLASQKGDLPPKYDVVYPYVSDKSGRYISQLQPCPNANNHSNRRPRALKNRGYRNSIKSRSDKLFVVIKLPEEKLILVLRPNKKLTLNRPQVEFVDKSGQIKRSFISQTCHYVGRVKNKKLSSVSLSNCNGRLLGLIRTSKTDYFIEPLTEWKNHFLRRKPHIIYGVETALTWKNVSIFGDILHPKLQRYQSKVKRDTWSYEDDFPIFINASTELYLETLVIVDNTVVKFHGSESNTAEYILTIMNIVSNIYEDSALNANIQIAISKIVIASQSKYNVSIIKGENKVSIESVCNLTAKIKSEDNINADITIYLTRDDIGGVAGFAPLSSICDSANSCTVNRDEGLTSAFVLAHEIAHVLGLAHDGDEGKGNNCLLEHNQHSIMAPTVVSNFNRYYWSNCSIDQFHKQRERWFCMLNKPKTNSQKAQPQEMGEVYTLDEQCRQEFDESHRHCKHYKTIDPCQILWCSSRHKKTVCITKQKPPLDGTQCGESKWCMNGHCVKKSKRKLPRNSIYRNPRNGGWGEWSPFGHCSRSCGMGVMFRTRKCNNPEPAYGGRNCKGDREEFQLCNTQKCPEVKDFRAEQCRTYGKQYPNFSFNRNKNNWVPAIVNDPKQNCKLLCYSKHNKQNYTGENVVDGTPCTYDGSLNICVQGSCQMIGCDGVLGSNARVNNCGVCNKNNSFCKVTEKLYSKIPSKRFTRVGVIPKRARNIMVRKTIGAPNFIVLQSKRYREFVLNGGKDQSTSKIFVAMGTIFNYTVNNGTEIISASGPILDELAVLISVKRWKTPVKIFSNYTLPKNKSFDSIINPEEFYYWKVIGWSKCSSICNEGGIQTLITHCIDKRLKHSVSKRHCSLLDKPTIRKRKCNGFPCQWRTSPWEYCSHTCGSKGVQYREIKCVVKNNRSETEVKPSRCAAQGRPIQQRSCNNRPCPSDWLIGPWSQCSTSCGNGTRERNITCIPPENEVHHDCFDPPSRIEICEGPPCPEKCVDLYETCKDEVLHHYCIIPDYYSKCCKTCHKYINRLNDDSQR